METDPTRIFDAIAYPTTGSPIATDVVVTRKPLPSGVSPTQSSFVCLRTLETGHPAWGGASVVWTALAVLASLALTFAWVASFPEADEND